MNENIQAQITDVFNEFNKIINDIIGVYFDSTLGFHHLLKDFEKNREKTIEMLKTTNPELANAQHLDQAWYMYGHGDPNKNNAVDYHRTTQSEFQERNTKSGRNYKFIGNMSLIIIYQYWEDYFRVKISKILNVHKDNIQSDLFGDIRLIRISIIHHRSVAKDEIKRCKILKWFNPGEEIFINEDKLIQILQEMNKFKFSIISSNK